MKISNQNFAFTLAEVLVTLAIIGVIAAMSVPTLIQQTNEAELKTAWKENFAMMSQAINRMNLDDGADLKYYVNTGGAFMPKLRSYFSTLKVSSYAATEIANAYKDMSGVSFDPRLMDDGQMVLSNGAFVGVENFPGGTNPLILWIDVNGIGKGPNILGRDLFGAEVVDYNRLVPIGANGVTKISCGCSKNPCVHPSYAAFPLAGAGCSADYL